MYPQDVQHGAERLSDEDARHVLGIYRIPIVSTRAFSDPDSAIDFALSQNAPLAIKATAAGIIHKREHGCVQLNVDPSNGRGVQKAVENVLQSVRSVPNTELQNLLVEEMVEPGLELALGGLRDESYGQVMMFGFGGTYIEVLKQVALRLVPIRHQDALNLIESTSVGNAINRFFRSSADSLKAQLVDILMALGGPSGLLAREPIVDLDINPLIISSQRITAVDVRMYSSSNALHNKDSAKEIATTAWNHLDPFFTPSSVLVVGASTNPEKLGNRVVKHLVDFGYKGDLIPIHPTAMEIHGKKCRSSIDKVDVPIDRVAIVTGAELVPAVLKQAAENGAKVAQIYSAGFGEWDSNGGQLEESLRDIVSSSDIQVIGPNCIGTYCPTGGLTMVSAATSGRESGRIAFASQSGTYATDAVRRGFSMGVRFSKVVSIGNCLDVDPTKLLHYFDQDEETDLIAFYIESSVGAGEFFRAARDISKPILLLKGGRTEAGSRAVTSHTGKLGDNYTIWNGAAEQVGAVSVESIEDLLDACLAFQTLKPLDSSTIALFGSGGGVVVEGADVAHSLGLTIADLHEETRRRLLDLGLPVGTSITNPIDVHVYALRGQPALAGKIASILREDPGVGSCVVFIEAGSFFDMANPNLALDYVREVAESVASSTKSQASLLLVYRSGEDLAHEEIFHQLRKQMVKNDIPLYRSVDRALRALSVALKLGQQSRQRTSHERLDEEASPIHRGTDQAGYLK